MDRAAASSDCLGLDPFCWAIDQNLARYGDRFAANSDGAANKSLIHSDATKPTKRNATNGPRTRFGESGSPPCSGGVNPLFSSYF